VDGFLAELRRDLKARSFRPLPVRQRNIPKANGKLRALGIPTVRDRVVQASLKLVLEPILSATDTEGPRFPSSGRGQGLSPSRGSCHSGTPGLGESRMRREPHVRFGRAVWGNGAAEHGVPEGDAAAHDPGTSK
jgi:hypothetical protein